MRFKSLEYVDNVNEYPMISLHGNNKEVYVDYASEHPMISPHSNN